MSKNDNKSSSDKKININDSGRSLPTTSTQTPMPEVKPPKPAESSSSGNKK